MFRAVGALGADVGARDGGGHTPLHYAAWGDAHELVRVFGELGAEIEAKSDNGWTPLHMAAQRGFCEASRMLVTKLGAVVCAKTDDGKTPSALRSRPLPTFFHRYSVN